MRAPVTAFLALVVAAGVACGSDGSTAPDVPDAIGDVGGTDPGSPVDPGTPQDPGTPDTAGDPAPAEAVDDPGTPPVPSGMMLAAGVQDVGGGTVITNALFFNAKVDEGARCALHAEGACRWVDCRPADGTVTPGRDAGTVTVGIAGDAAKTLTLAPGAQAVYAPAFQAKALWADGNTLAFEGKGGADVQPFLLPLVLPPVPASIGWPQAETVSGREVVPVTRGEPFTATWTAAPGQVMILLAQSPNQPVTWQQDLQIVCFFDGTAGTGTVPGAVTGLLAASDPATNLLIGVEGIATENTTPGPVTLVVGLFHGVVRPGFAH